jgi:hypothetical protein
MYIIVIKKLFEVIQKITRNKNNVLSDIVGSGFSGVTAFGALSIFKF